MSLWYFFSAIILAIVLSPKILLSQERHPGNAKWAADEIVVKFRLNISEDKISKINQQHATAVLYTSPYAHFKRIKTAPNKTAQEMVKIYQDQPEVEYAELNYYAYAHMTPNDQYYIYQWNFKHPSAGVNIEPAWDITTGDPNVIIAVVDTGIAYENYPPKYIIAPDLVNTHFVPGYNFVADSNHPNDDDGHGTHVTGTIAQSTNNSIGVAGIAFNCSIMPVKVLNKRGEAAYTTVADGIYFAADNGANIINMSLGGTADSITLRDAVAYAYGKGVVIICSAGNEYDQGNLPNYPAAYDQYCIAVGATKSDRTRAFYSNTGSYIDVVAPGGELIDLNGDGQPDGILQQTFDKTPKDMDYWFFTGTSMAAPHVSGIAGLLMSKGTTSQNGIRKALQNTARDLGPSGWDEEYGWGLVDVNAALKYCENDLTGDCAIDYKDLAVLCMYWLENEPSVDIKPAGGDGIINFLDFTKLSLNWGR